MDLKFVYEHNCIEKKIICKQYASINMVQCVECSAFLLSIFLQSKFYLNRLCFSLCSALQLTKRIKNVIESIVTILLFYMFSRFKNKVMNLTIKFKNLDGYFQANQLHPVITA